MSESIIIVTGSRALAGSAREADAVNILETILSMSSDDTIIVTGDARLGPDAWAVRHVSEGLFIRERRVWALDRWIYVNGEPSAEWISEEKAREGGVLPLIRNKRMIASCVRRMEEGADVHIVGVEARWSKTHGTAHTMDLAVRAGIRSTHITFGL